ncbi:unnamed protein product [Vicia faba]|uniref:non-specific serine/threonine protein kinase n=1 Tax=Vicia faba TaxID=3906 RepID=A0AAV1ACW0_VICFA|nr:unnamed protein product [Vicia faba]
MSSIAISYGEKGSVFCGLKSDGLNIVTCYGSNSVIMYETPMHFSFHGLTCGDGFVCGLLMDSNQPYCWGNNGYIQMGVPQPMIRETQYFEIRAGDYHVCGLRKVRNRNVSLVDCWGYNMTANYVLDGMIQSISVGSAFNCGLFSSNESVFCWGDETSNKVISFIPLKMKFRMIYAEGFHVCGILEGVNLRTFFGGRSLNIEEQISATTYILLTSLKILICLLLKKHATCDWKMHKKIINFCQITGHSSHMIGKYADDYLRSWGLSQILTITVDNASENTIMIKYLNIRIRLKENKSCIKKIRHAVKYVKSSPRRLVKFMEYAVQEKVTYKGVVILDDEARWNSTYSMLKVALQYQKYFDLLYARDKTFHEEMDKMNEGVKKEDWAYVASMFPLLEMFYNSINHLSGSLHVTSASYLAEVFTIGKGINKNLKSNNEHIKNTANKMKGKFNKY